MTPDEICTKVSDVKVPLRITLYAGDVLVADAVDSRLWSYVLGVLLERVEDETDAIGDEQ